MTQLSIRGRFEDQRGAPVTGAAVIAFFQGDPPTNFATTFDLERVEAHTDDSGEFQVDFGNPDTRPELSSRPGVWRRGCFFVLAVKDAHTLGYILATGKELAAGPTRLVALPVVDVRGTVVDEGGRAIEGARIISDNYLLKVGRGPRSHELINIRLTRPAPALESEGEARVAPGLIADADRDGDRPLWIAPVARYFLGMKAETDRDGVFVLRDVPATPGGRFMTASHPDLVSLMLQFDPRQPLPPLVMPAGARVTLRITLPDGTPARGFHLYLTEERACHPKACEATEVSAVSGFSPPLFGVTDESGQCVFRRLLPGDYAIRYVKGPAVSWAVPVITVKGLAKGEHRELEVTAVEGTILWGMVTEAGTGRPIEDAEVRYESRRYPRGGPFQHVCTDAQGRYAIATGLACGSFILRVSARHLGRGITRRHRVVIGPEPRTEMNFTLPFKENRNRPRRKD